MKTDERVLALTCPDIFDIRYERVLRSHCALVALSPMTANIWRDVHQIQLHILCRMSMNTMWSVSTTWKCIRMNTF